MFKLCHNLAVSSLTQALTWDQMALFQMVLGQGLYPNFAILDPLNSGHKEPNQVGLLPVPSLHMGFVIQHNCPVPTLWCGHGCDSKSPYPVLMGFTV